MPVKAERLAINTMRLWTLRAWKRDTKRDQVYSAECSFLSYAETIEEAFQFAYAAGFACLRRMPDGDIVANAQMSVRMSSIGYTGEL